MLDFLRSHADYGFFCLGWGAVFAGLALALPRWRPGARYPRLLWVPVFLILLTGCFVADNAGVEAQREVEHSVSALAPTYAYELQRMGHAQITEKTAPDDPLYLRMCETINHWRELNPAAHDLYTMRRRADGQVVLIVDPENSPGDDRTPIGTVYEQPDHALPRALAGEAFFDREIISDRWGTWVGAWAPLFDENGRVEAVLGMDYDASEWLAAARHARWRTMFVLALMLATLAFAAAGQALASANLARRRLDEDRQRMADERTQLIVRQMPLALIEWSVDAEVVAWNPAAERIFGYRAAEVMGRKIFSWIVPANLREDIDKVFATNLRQAPKTQSVNENLTKSGRTITCEWLNRTLVDDAGKVIGVLSLTQDITERVGMEKHLAQAHRMNAVGQLAAGVANDFNNILTIVSGHAGLLLSDPALAPKLRADVERIEDASQRAASLTRQLLAFSRQQAMFPRPLHVNEVVERTTSLLARVLGDHIILHCRLGHDLPAIEADPAMLDQVFTNLALNARDAMPRGGDLVFGTESLHIPANPLPNPEARPGAAVCITVSDTGGGIASEMLPRIFEPFFTTKDTGKGTGLGLAVVHGIVRQHQGWIEVQSKIGSGTQFRVYLPATEKVPASNGSQREREDLTTPARRRQTILIAEDESVVRELARLILERAGYDVIEAADGVQAFALWTINREKIDLLLTDMVMPNGMTGGELAQRVLTDCPALPVLYVSGYSMELTAPDFIETDRQVFLQKPYLSDELVSTVRTLLQKAPRR